MEILQPRSDPVIFLIILTPTEHKYMKRWAESRKESIKRTIKKRIDGLCKPVK